MQIRKHMIFSGEVQGVGFRYRAFVYAQELGLTGWVINLDDGRVEMEGGRYRKTAMRGAHGGVMGNEVRRGRVMACALRGGLL